MWLAFLDFILTSMKSCRTYVKLAEPNAPSPSHHVLKIDDSNVQGRLLEARNAGMVAFLGDADLSPMGETPVMPLLLLCDSPPGHCKSCVLSLDVDSIEVYGTGVEDEATTQSQEAMRRLQTAFDLLEAQT
jgi:hypothetical protein